jgi:hypothetical protein
MMPPIATAMSIRGSRCGPGRGGRFAATAASGDTVGGEPVLIRGSVGPRTRHTSRVASSGSKWGAPSFRGHHTRAVVGPRASHGTGSGARLPGGLSIIGAVDALGAVR